MNAKHENRAERAARILDGFDGAPRPGVRAFASWKVNLIRLTLIATPQQIATLIAVGRPQTSAGHVASNGDEDAPALLIGRGDINVWGRIAESLGVEYAEESLQHAEQHGRGHDTWQGFASFAAHHEEPDLVVWEIRDEEPTAQPADRESEGARA